MIIDFTKNDDNTALIRLTAESHDYVDKLDSELRKHQKKVNLKGFRKGKTPVSVLRKMYGNALLAEVVSKMIEEAIPKRLEEEKVDVIFRPMPSASQKPVDFHADEEVSYTFEFEMGIRPEFEIRGLEEPYQYFDTLITDEAVDRQIDNLRRRGGSREEITGGFEGEDIITINAWEMDEDDIKKDGLETEFIVKVDNMGEEFKDLVLSKEVGNTIDFDIYKVDKMLSDEGVHKHILKLDEEDEDLEVNPMFRGEIVGATRLVLAELDEEYLEMAFGEEVKTIEDARILVRDDLKAYYDGEADTILFQAVYDKMMEETMIDMPDEFIIRWLFNSQHNKENGSDTFSLEEIAKQYYEEQKRSLRWQLISDKLLRKYDVEVSKDEIIEELGNRIQHYMAGQQLTNDAYNQILQTLTKDETQVLNARNKVMSNKIFKALKGDLVLDKEEISQKGFDKTLNDIVIRNKASSMLSDPDYDDQFEEE